MPELAAHLERVAKELAHEYYKTHCLERDEEDLTKVVAAALAACAREARNEALEEAANEARRGDNGHDPSERIAAAIRERAVGEKGRDRA